MKDTITVDKEIKVVYCDNCFRRLTIVNLETGETGGWIDGAFQCGQNKYGKIGSWCCKKCFQEGEVI